MTSVENTGGRGEGTEGAGRGAAGGLNRVSGAIIGAAIEVHRQLGPGLLESAHESCLERELTVRGLGVERQRIVPVTYRGLRVPRAYRMDFVVNRLVVVEIKAVDRVLQIHEAQLLSYLRLSNLKLGLLINFHVGLLKHGIKRLCLF